MANNPHRLTLHTQLNILTNILQKVSVNLSEILNDFPQVIRIIFSSLVRAKEHFLMAKNNPVLNDFFIRPILPTYYVNLKYQHFF